MNREEYIEIVENIISLKAKLHYTDYIDNKLTEAIAKYVVTGDSTDVVRIYNEYRDLIEQRQAWRDEINVLEQACKTTL